MRLLCCDIQKFFWAKNHFKDFFVPFNIGKGMTCSCGFQCIFSEHTPSLCHHIFAARELHCKTSSNDTFVNLLCRTPNFVTQSPCSQIISGEIIQDILRDYRNNRFFRYWFNRYIIRND